MNNTDYYDSDILTINSDSTYESSSDFDDIIDEIFDSYTNNNQNNNQNNKKYSIVLCELYNENILGYNVSNYILGQYIVIRKFKKLNIDYIYAYSSGYRQHYYNILQQNNYIHPIIRNYNSIINLSNYLTPQIAYTKYTDSFHCIAIIKTLWLKLIQRTWKKIYSLKKEIIKQRLTPKSLIYREIYGCWPNKLKKLPTIKGMLHYLDY